MTAATDRGVRLRPASASDCRAIYQWNCDPAVRAVSRDPRPVEWATHQAWFAAALANPTCTLYVVVDAGDESTRDLGVVRVTWGDRGGVVSIALDPAARGRGVGAAAIRALCRSVAQPLVAEILAENQASLRCFGGVGFCEVFRSETPQGELIVMEWMPHA